jgi:hypothetical protein
MPISGAKRVVCVVDVDAGKIYVGMVPLASGGVFDDRPPRSGIECGWIQSDPLVVLQGGMHAGRGDQQARPDGIWVVACWGKHHGPLAISRL